MTHARALPQQILAHALKLGEGAPLTAKGLLHLGNRAAIDQALKRLAERGALMKVSRGIYVLPVQGRFGQRPPSVEKIVERLASTFGETVVAHGAAAANRLGLTTQVPVRPVYLTSGRPRRLEVGRQKIELRSAPPHLLACPNRPAGEALRALAWLGRNQAHEASRKISKILESSEREAFEALRSTMPGWMAASVSEAMVNG